MIEGGITLGQSNAGYADGEPGGPLMRTFGPEARLLMLAGKPGGSIGIEHPDVFKPQLVDYCEPDGCGQSPAAMLAFAAQRIDMHFGEEVRHMAIHSSFRGSVSLTSLFPGEPFNIHENAIAALEAIKTAAEYTGASYRLDWIDLIHGEGGPYEGYGALLEVYIKTLKNACAEALRQDSIPAILISQINSFSCADAYNPVVLDQLAFARNFQAEHIYLAGPMYQCPFYDPGHLTDIGRMIHGEIRGLVRHTVIRQRRIWNPLWPANDVALRRGRTIEVPMVMPPEANRLVLDIDWIPPVADQGFVYFDEMGQAVAIDAIELHTDFIAIHLADDAPEGGGRLEYAMHNGKDVLWWASGRGHLYAETDIPSVYAALGFALPATIRHYCVSFSLPVMRHIQDD